MHESEITITLKCDSQIKKLKWKVKMEKKNQKGQKSNMSEKNIGAEFESEKWIFFFFSFACLFIYVFIYLFWNPSHKGNKWLMK